jgi:hypothetical protein
VFSSSGWVAVLEGFVMGALRAVPAGLIVLAVFRPLLSGATHTGTYIVLYCVFNLVGNGLEAAITAPLAIRVARTVNPAVGYGEGSVPGVNDVSDGGHGGTRPEEAGR